MSMGLVVESEYAFHYEEGIEFKGNVVDTMKVI